MHVQDIAQWQGIYDITTGSLVSYPHPYRVICVHTNAQGKPVLKIESHRITAVEDRARFIRKITGMDGGTFFSLYDETINQSTVKINDSRSRTISSPFALFLNRYRQRRYSI